MSKMRTLAATTGLLAVALLTSACGHHHTVVHHTVVVHHHVTVHHYHH